MQHLDKGNTWLHTEHVETRPDMWEELLGMMPQERQKVRVYGKTHLIARRTESYGKDYDYGSAKKIGSNMPEVLLHYLEVANEFATSVGWPEFNQCLVNWYIDDDAYLGKHSDDENDMYVDEHGHTVVYGITFCNPEQSSQKPRVFRVRDKETNKIIKDIPTDNGCVVVMGGEMQRYYTHEIPKHKNRQERISITFRTLVN